MVRLVLTSVCAVAAYAATCADDPEVDLCDDKGVNATAEDNFATRQMSAPMLAFALAIANGFGNVRGVGSVTGPLLMSAMMVPAKASDSVEGHTEGSPFASARSTCKQFKDRYKEGQCCGESAEKQVEYQVIPLPSKRLNLGANPCSTHTKLENQDCVQLGMEQAGADISKQPSDRVTAGIETTVGVEAAKKRWAIGAPYWQGNKSGEHAIGPLCPVNVHWHLGAEHRSKGEFDENGKSPTVGGSVPASAAPTRRLRSSDDAPEARQLAGTVRYGFACHHYVANDPKWNTEYKWQHCQGMKVGATYEIHWPHSALGACNTPWQYQSPFYDGIFCNYDPNNADLKSCVDTPDCLSNAAGVQGQVFTIINDDSYYYPNLFKGMIINPSAGFGADIAYYTGSSTGTSRDNTMCSPYTPITWQVDRKCHIISASSFDKLCADMRQNYDDMSSDLHAHGARELVKGQFAADNQQTLR